MNNINPKITIVTVTYNAENFLEETILSVINQDYQNIEYIIIDGASTDKTTDIIKKYEKYITYWISEEDSGIYHAMNKGIKKASGEWINFMNAGDSFSSLNVISEIFKINYNEDILYSDTNIIDFNQNILRVFMAKNLSSFLIPKMSFIHQSSFIRTRLIKNREYNKNYKLASDFDFFLYAYLNNYKFQYIHLIIANFLEGGLHTNNMVQYVAESIDSLIKQHPNLDHYHNNYGVIKALEPYNNQLKNKFPTILSKSFSKIDNLFNKNKKIILYGYGMFGKLIYKSYKDSIIAIIDKSLSLQSQDLPIINLKDLENIEFDFILISLLNREKEIIQSLRKNNINSNRIVYLDYHL